MEKQELVERLNENLNNETYQRNIHLLMQKGIRFSNLWKIINTVSDMDEYKRKTIYTCPHELMEEGLKLGEKLFSLRKKKEAAIKEMNYEKAKKYFRKEYELKFQILKYFRKNDLRKHCLISNYTVDVLEPNLIDLKELK